MLDYLPEPDRATIKCRMRRAWAQTRPHPGAGGAAATRTELDRSHRGAAASLREGLEEMLTLARLDPRVSPFE